ncbi:MAG TPA: MFS transporter, partial [Puia sp.]|nr:MFS transporter [Puia sp.]
SLFTAVTGIVNGFIALLIVRFLFGMGESGTMPNSVLVISRWFPANETGRALPWMGIGTQIGAAIAPLIVLPLAAAYGWRLPFFVNGAIGVLWVLVCWAWFRNFPREMRNISEKELNLIENNRRYNAGHHLISWRVIFGSRTLWALMLMYFCFQWANYFFVAWMPVYLQEHRHFSEQQTQPIIFWVFVVGIIGLLTGGFFIDWTAKKLGLYLGRRIIGMFGIGACGVSVFVAGFTIDPWISAISLVAANFFYSFGVMSPFAVCTDIGRNNAGTVTGAMNFCGQMGAFFLAIVFGKIVTLTHDFQIPLYLIALAQLIGFLLWFLIDPRKQLKLETTK